MSPNDLTLLSVEADDAPTGAALPSAFRFNVTISARSNRDWSLETKQHFRLDAAGVIQAMPKRTKALRGMAAEAIRLLSEPGAAVRKTTFKHADYDTTVVVERRN